MKLCRNCIHCAVSESPEFSKCNAGQNMVPSPVTGEYVRRYDYCSTMRLDSTSDAYRCGTEARYFVAFPTLPTEEESLRNQGIADSLHDRREYAAQERERQETERPR